MPQSLTNFLLIFVGGGTGAFLRYHLGSNVQRLSSSLAPLGSVNVGLFPVGTLVVNLVGCLLIGLLTGIAEFKGIITPELRLLLVVGFLGGFTTFASFGFETMQLLRGGQIVYACMNIFLQMLCGLCGVWLGMILAKLV
jgi:fluoride exporter